MTCALRIQGRQGRHANLNTTYEPTDQTYHGKPVWASTGETPAYIYHSGKARWVVSKRVDDGCRCYLFLKDDGVPNPGCSSSPVVCFDTDGEWRSDPNTSISEVPATGDKFKELRASVEGELQTYGLTETKMLRPLWKKLDYNGNGIVSLAEVDKLVVEMTDAGSWPAWLNNKPALMRAFKKTTLKDGDGDDWVQKREFSALLLNLFWFNKLWVVFDNIDQGDDRRIDLQEFITGMHHLGLDLNEEEAAEEFQKIDTNDGGMVLFVEFCAYVRKRVNPDSNPAFDADVVSGEKCSNFLRRSRGNKATSTHYVTPKTEARFTEIENHMKEIIADQSKLRALWGTIDFNGNNIVSLAEVDKMVVERFPLLNHKPALMRAFKATLKKGDGDDWVQKHEFKMLLGNLVYFNKLFWLFDDVDGDKDRRMDFNEFKQCLTLAGAQISEADMEAEFASVDTNGGGIVLFDEFCAYFARKSCPECLTDALE